LPVSDGDRLDYAPLFGPQDDLKWNPFGRGGTPGPGPPPCRGPSLEDTLPPGDPPSRGPSLEDPLPVGSHPWEEEEEVEVEEEEEEEARTYQGEDI